MRFGFVTCVSLGLGCMEEIEAQGGRLDLVLTLRGDLAAEKSGRVSVDDFCQRTGVPLIKIANVNDSYVVDVVEKAELDVLFIVGWSQIARSEILAAPRVGVFGMHPTLLPEGRGRASIPWAILKGLRQTGVTLFKLDTGVDTGPVVAQERISISRDESAATLYEKVVRAHRLLIRENWATIEEGSVSLQTQDEARATEWPARSPADGQIRAGMTVREAEILVRATTRPYPGAYFDGLPDGRLRIWAGFPGRGSHPTIRLSDGYFNPVDFQWEQP